MTTSARNAVIRVAEQPVADRGNGIRTIPLVSPSHGARELICGFTIFPPGGAIAEHFHNCEESVTLIEGDAVATIEGVEHPLKPGDTSWIAAGVPHFFRNTSATKEMRILWTYASVEATRTLVSTGETRPVAAEHAKNKLVR